MERDRTLGDVAAEMEGLEALIDMVSFLVAPTDVPIRGSVPTQETVDRAFYSIASTVRLIREEISAWDGYYTSLGRNEAV